MSICAVICYFREKKPEADSASEAQAAAAEICRRCLERHVEGIESCMQNAYLSRSRFYVPPTTTSTVRPQTNIVYTTATTTNTTITTTASSSNSSSGTISAPSSTSSLAKISTVNQNHLTVPKHPHPFTFRDYRLPVTT